MLTEEQVITNAVRAQLAGDYEKAEHYYRMVLERRSEDPVLLFGYGSLRLSVEDYTTALLVLQAAAEYNPPLEYQDQIYNNLGVCLKWVNRRQEAIDCFEKSWALLDEIEQNKLIGPDEVMRRRRSVLINHGSMYINYGEPRTAEKFFSEAHEWDKKLGGNNPQTLWNLSLSLLEQSKWARGFDLYRSGIDKGDRQDRTFWQQGNTPWWDGEPVGTLVIYGEQGIGDEILFMSAVEEARTKAQRIIIDCTPRLLETFKRSFPWAEVYCSADNKLPDWARHRKIDAKCLMGDLCRLYRRSAEDFKRQPGRFLEPSAAKVEQMRWRFDQLPYKTNVAIMWRGGTVLTNRNERSVPLDLWTDILSQDANFHSLQYTEGAKEESLCHNVHHWQDVVDDIDAQFALIGACDLVITCCGTPAHMAGALGKPCWVLAPMAIRWCYVGPGERTPFYSSLRCFRQKERGNWRHVLRKASRELADFIELQSTQRDAA